MHFDSFAARLALALGLCVLLATSDEVWHASKTVDTQLQSQGHGDDKLVRIHAQITGSLARKTNYGQLILAGTANRPISDVRFDWIDSPQRMPSARDASSDASSQDGGALSPAYVTTYSKDFTELTATAPYPCREPMGSTCELIAEARVSAAAAIPYTLMLEVQVEIEGDESERPKGSIELVVEVLDAP